MDHILNSGLQSVLQPTGFLVSTDADIAEISDHRPLWAHYAVAGGRKRQQRGKAKRLQLLHTELTWKDKMEVQRYQDIVSEKFSVANLENMVPEEIIHRLSRLSYELVQEPQPKALTNIRRHIYGFQKQRKWASNSRYFSQDLSQKVKTWRSAVMNKGNKLQNAWKLTDITG